MANNKKIQPLKIKELFSQNEQYLIPIYQRNYAWEKGQVEQLIQDILDFTSINQKNEENDHTNIYYIGTLVVFARKDKNGQTIYETIDGQQRLTTLSILLSVLKNKFDMKFDFRHILSYESRESSNKTFEAIYRKPNNKKDDIFTDRDDYNSTMKNSYQTIESMLSKINENNRLENFIDYLLEHVEILRVSVPDDTDLNHYFEIMNNRGEQLENHEVLKANMLSVFDKSEQNERMVFSKIWDACSDISRYVQYGFINTQEKKYREKIFGTEWNNFQINSFDDLLEIYKDEKNNESSDGLTIEEIVKPENSYDIDNKDDKSLSERFISPINFQNFLLHVLRIMIKNDNERKYTAEDQDIKLDDKRLIKSFEPLIEKKEFVKDFGFELLKSKYLFDNYIIKRDYSQNSEDGEWSLKKLKQESSAQYSNSFGDENNEQSNKQLIMLLSMFHVSNPSQIYKHWLTAVLNYLNKQSIDQVSSKEYINYLEKLAKLFLMNGYLSNLETNYTDIIFNEQLCINQDINLDLLNRGTNVENFIFNYLDYLLWKEDTSRVDNDKKFKNFQFTFKSSVEHVYPQHPKDGQKRLQDESKEIDYLNSFGNLCLISASKNSALSNYQPIAKKDHYNKSGYDSNKQQLMMVNADKWWIDTIQEHQREMIKILGLTNEN